MKISFASKIYIVDKRQKIMNNIDRHKTQEIIEHIPCISLYILMEV